MYTMTLALSVVYWGLLAAILGGQVVEGAIVSAVLMDVPGMGTTRVEGETASALALGLPGGLFLIAGGIGLLARMIRQQRATERVLVAAEG
ncbi:MAG: hypothetical protein AAFP17_02170 [Pseudomonadota bacterium]